MPAVRPNLTGGLKQRFTKRQKWLVGGGIIILCVALIGYVAYRVGLGASASAGQTQIFVVKRGENANAVATNLKRAGLIRNRTAFLTYLNFHGLRTRLKAGTYSVSPTKSGPFIVNILIGGQTLINRIIVPEGYRIAQIKDLAAKKGISKTDFDAALAAPHAQSFFASKPKGVSLEGYLFPDSYEVGETTTATQLVETMLQNFGQRVGPEYAQAFAAQGLSLHQGLTLASIVEREVNIPADRPIVAQIFLKRFREKQPLGSDVTVHYASDLAGVAFNLDINSPYNTRKFVGLPPGPIASPGLSALDAVARPAHTSYNYFLSGNDGKTYYANTYSEHQLNISKYLK